jgi:hypothetical protein
LTRPDHLQVNPRRGNSSFSHEFGCAIFRAPAYYQTALRSTRDMGVPCLPCSPTIKGVRCLRGPTRPASANSSQQAFLQYPGVETPLCACLTLRLFVEPSPALRSPHLNDLTNKTTSSRSDTTNDEAVHEHPDVGILSCSDAKLDNKDLEYSAPSQKTPRLACRMIRGGNRREGYNGDSVD